jgi:serine protein kinase
MEACPIYVLKAGDEISPIFESPLGLFDPRPWARSWRALRHPPRRLTGIMSPGR